MMADHQSKKTNIISPPVGMIIPADITFLKNFSKKQSVEEMDALLPLIRFVDQRAELICSNPRQEDESDSPVIRCIIERKRLSEVGKPCSPPTGIMEEGN